MSKSSKKMKHGEMEVMPKTDKKESSKNAKHLIFIKKASDSMTSLVGVRSEEELCGCMIESYRYFSKVVNCCIKDELHESSAVVRQLLQKFLLLCYSIKKDLLESTLEEKHVLSYERLASIFLTQLFQMTILSRDINKLMRCSTISTHLFLVLDSSLLHMIETVINVKHKLFTKVAAAYLPVYLKVMDKCAETVMTVDLYLRCIVLSIQFFKKLPDNLRHHVFACLRRIETGEILLKQAKKRLKSNWPVGTDVNNMSINLLKKLPDHYPKKLIKQINKDAIACLMSTNARNANSFTAFEKNPSPSSGLFFVDKKADTDILRSFTLENYENAGGSEESEGDEPTQREMDDLIEDFDLTTTERKSAMKRKKNSQSPQTDKKRKNKRESVDSTGILNHVNQHDLSKEDSLVEEESDVEASESSLECEQLPEEEESRGRKKATKSPQADKKGKNKRELVDSTESLSRLHQLDLSIEDNLIVEESDIAASESSLECEQYSDEEESDEEGAEASLFDKFNAIDKLNQPASCTGMKKAENQIMASGKNDILPESKNKGEKLDDSENSSDGDQEDLKDQVVQEVELADTDEDDAVLSDSSLVTLENNQIGEKVTEVLFSGKLDSPKHVKEGDNKADDDQEVESVDSDENDLVFTDTSILSDDTVKNNQPGEKADEVLILDEIYTPQHVKRDDNKASKSMEPERLQFLHTPRSDFNLVSTSPNKIKSKSSSPSKGSTTPKKWQNIAVDNAADVRLLSGNDDGVINFKSAHRCKSEKQEAAQNQLMVKQKISPVVHLAKIDKSPNYGKLIAKDEAMDVDLTPDSDSDEEMVLKRKMSSKSRLVLSSSEEEKDSDGDSADRIFLPDNSDADSERSSVIFDVSPRRNNCGSSSPRRIDEDVNVTDFFNDEANVDNRREEDMGDSEDSDVNDFLNDDTSESDGSEESDEEIDVGSPLKRKSGANGRPERHSDSKVVAKSQSPSPTKNIANSDKRSPTMSALTQSFSSSGSNQPSLGTRALSISPNPYVQLTDVNRKSLNGSPTLRRGYFSEEKSGEDNTPKSKSPERKNLRGASTLRKGRQRRRSLQNSGGDIGGKAASSPPEEEQPVAGTILGYSRKLRHNCIEVKTEPRKIGRTTQNDVAETPVTKKTKVTKKQIAASAVTTRTGRKFRIDTETDDEKKTTMLRVRMPRRVLVSKTSPRVLRSGYNLRQRSNNVT